MVICVGLGGGETELWAPREGAEATVSPGPALSWEPGEPGHSIIVARTPGLPLQPSHSSHTHHPSSGSQLTASCRGPWVGSPVAAAIRILLQLLIPPSRSAELVTTQCSGSQFRFLFGSRWPGQGSSALCTGLALVIHNKHGTLGKSAPARLADCAPCARSAEQLCWCQWSWQEDAGPSENNVKCEHHVNCEPRSQVTTKPLKQVNNNITMLPSNSASRSAR